MNIHEELSWRGLIHQSTDEAGLRAWLDQPRTLYIGFDPSADSLHLGSLLQLMNLKRFQLAGHRVIALLGGATGMIGDPSGKSAERNLLSVDQLEFNVAAQRTQMEAVLDFEDSANPAILVNNFDWMKDFSYLEFLRDVGKHFPVNVMLGKDSVKGRLESEAGLSYTEFSYMLLQGYDFVRLNELHGCELQYGGSDQWGNITAGIDLARRMRGVQLYGMTCPLLTKADGTKMGKTETGAIWLDPQRTSPYQFYQYLIRLSDDDAGSVLRFLTLLPQEEIKALDAAREREAHKKESQQRLAEELTCLVHGASGLDTARKATEVLYGAEIEGLSEQDLVTIFDDVPSSELDRSRLEGEGMPLIDAFVEAGLAKSKSEARRTIQQGGAYVNNRRCSGIDQLLRAQDLVSETVIVLRSGKKHYALLRFPR